MNRIKTIAFSALLSIGAFGAITYTACNKDECKDVVCSNGGTCVSGTCSCPAGYEGATCQTLSTAKFIKTWTAPNDMNVASGVKLNAYTCIITQGSSLNTLIIGTGFYDNFFQHSINATVTGTTINVPTQSPDGASNYSVIGSATYNSNGTLSWSYTITPPAGVGSAKNYTGTWN